MEYLSQPCLPQEQLISLYDSVGWSNYTQKPDMLAAAYQHSLWYCAAMDGDKLAGILRVVGDGHSIVYVQDLLVRPAYQRQGIGRKLLQLLLEQYGNVYQMVLLTEETVKNCAFYESLGFVHATHMGCCAFARMKV